MLMNQIMKEIDTNKKHQLPPQSLNFLLSSIFLPHRTPLGNYVDARKPVAAFYASYAAFLKIFDIFTLKVMNKLN